MDCEVTGKQINDFKYLALIDIGEEDKIQVTSELIIDSIEKKSATQTFNCRIWEKYCDFICHNKAR